jgi:endonuclease/exonuclease/phosphatase family metal-dependent hydrolase
LFIIPLGCLISKRDRSPEATETTEEDYLFCFWNTENFFDNKVNGWKKPVDEQFDTWFAQDEKAFNQKVKNLTTVLAALNDGKGPDILALAEVEANSRAADALVESLNKAIKSDATPYANILIKNPNGGREIVTAIITRLPVVPAKTQLLGKRLRILEGHVKVADQDLTILVTHWTSRVSDKTGEGRAKYADQIYGRFCALHRANPNVSLLVCGDFNDNPDDRSVTRHLHAIGDLAKVKEDDDPPLLYNVFANRWAEHKDNKDKIVGTHYFHGKAFIFDQIVVSPGMVNDKGGWQYQVGSAKIVEHRFVIQRGKNKGLPLPFGKETDKTPLGKRGVSDHLPVAVRLKVAQKN